ncbi:ABC transporter ATP-binding protein [Croceicoccus gelatinilyticus]|uniref:ABC transporter ATP-binding protein n=1 Tax=Croceicoccus gelatinilyticus TaxID=2835536 RepID=UPI001BCB2C33|nr:ABC transporter ATP-binding protein [Croceicoccus gelatinilyticus]MBS7670146.1 ABC transporter ATP-binding protein [Croceicoccus gelatinilyticus]
MSSVRLEGIAKRFGSTEVIRGVDLDIQSGEFVVFVGASGSGKSTLLRMIAGLEQPSEGRVFIGDSDVTDAPPSERGVSMVFQSYALYPHMTVRENIAFGLKLKKTGKAAMEEAVTRVATMLEIEALLDRKPGQLSGGQRQRVAIARAIVREPDVFLFDEPLSNLDAALRTRTRIEIKDLHRKLAATMIYVTHDQVEAMSLADRMVILNGGHIEQVGPPVVLYHEPATKYVAAFLGSPTMNFLPPSVVGDAGGADSVGIRPEDMRVADSGLSGTIEEVEELGETRILHVKLEGGETIAVRDRSLDDPKIGQVVSVTFDDTAIHRFDAKGARI